MTEKPLLVIAAGGTGGHMFPAQALAETMLERGWRVRLSTDPRGARYTGGFPREVQIGVVRSATFARGGALAKLAAPFRIAAGIASAVRQMLADRPAVIVGFGGYPAIPAMAAAWFLRRPRMLHEQNGVLGRVNQLFSRRVDLIACGTWPTELPPGIEGIHTGNPVRAAVLEQAGAPYLPPGDHLMEILVMGGSQGARILSDVVPGAIAALPNDLRDRVRVCQQTREEDMDRVGRFYSEAGIAADLHTFITDVPDRLAQCQLLISRAGASSVADVSVVGRPAIFIPLASAIRDEQSANARGLVEAGAATLLPEANLTEATLAQEITTILDDPKKASRMAAAALATSVPDAANRLAALVERLAGLQKEENP